MNPNDPSVVFVGDPSPGSEFFPLDLACRFYGFRLIVASVPRDDGPAWEPAIPADPRVVLVVVQASARAPVAASTWQTLQAWTRGRSLPIAIVGLTPDSDKALLDQFAGRVKIEVTAAETDSRLWASATNSAMPGFELRGLGLLLGPGPASQLELEPLAESNAIVMAAVGPGESGSRPALLRLGGSETACYLLARTRGADPASAAPWEFRRSHFGEVLPFFLLMRDVGGSRCWHPPAAMANLTIDDPWLTEPYGCLTFPGLLAQMQRERFHATIGFVPWNYDRSSPEMVALIKSHPEYFSIAVHGNNHDRYEFFRYEPQPGDNQRAKPLAEQAFNIRQAMARMEAFQRFTGIEFDRVMVFPHGVCPAPTFAALKRQGFWATSNYSNVPLGERPPADPAVALRAANADWDGFPALRRNYPQNLSEEAIAIDLFLGNPVMVMAHQDLFFDGIDAFNAFARRVNIRQPAVQWLGLAEISRQLHLLRWLDPSNCDVRLISRHARIKNPRSAAVTFHFAKREPVKEPVVRVTLDGAELPWTFAEGTVRFSAVVSPHAAGLVEIHYRFPATSGSVDVSRRGFRNRTLRLIAEFRDLTLSRSVAGKLLTRKYYRQGKRRPTISGLLSRLTALLRTNRVSPPGPGRT